jgi:hypothetical protein
MNVRRWELVVMVVALVGLVCWHISVPASASSLLCIVGADMALGSTSFRSVFSVDGPPVTTTTTSTPPTHAPLQAEPHVLEAPPAIPRRY